MFEPRVRRKTPCSADGFFGGSVVLGAPPQLSISRSSPGSSGTGSASSLNQMAFGRVALPKRVWMLICFDLVVADGHDFLKVFADSLMAGTIHE